MVYLRMVEGIFLKAKSDKKDIFLKYTSNTDQKDDTSENFTLRILVILYAYKSNSPVFILRCFAIFSSTSRLGAYKPCSMFPM